MIFIDCGRFRDPILKAFWVLLYEKRYLFMLVSRLLFLMIFGSEDVSDWKTKHLAKGGIATINFRRSLISHDSSVHFS